jgi:DNA repair and recombination protein RAD54B
MASSNHCSSAEQFLSCFLLSLRMGLNLIGANLLIMFGTDYNPAIEAQAMARIYHPGQTNPTAIHRIFTAGTTEDVVYQRQQHKGFLANMTVDGTTTAESGKVAKEELCDCVSL